MPSGRAQATCANGADTEAAQSQEVRRQTRSSVFVAAHLEGEGAQAPVKIRNMSPNGAMIETALAPPPGTKVRLVRGSLVALGEVVWSRSPRCGLRFASELSVREWLAPPASLAQQRVDEVVAQLKARPPGASDLVPFTPAPEAPQARNPQLAHDLARALELLRDLGDELASSGETLARHARRLQNLDISMQVIETVADLLDTAGPAHIALSRLSSLRIACKEARRSFREDLPLSAPRDSSGRVP
jgi:hypothetical protein